VLSDRLTRAEIDATVRHVINELLALSDRPVRAFDEEDALVSTGLTSLDLAALVARLKRMWKVDPFLEATAITEIRTVGDLCRAYHEYINAS
jgi:acyl carrier protein